MFQLLTDTLQNVFQRLRGRGKITEAQVAETMREVRMALLEADVNFSVAKEFVERVRARCVGTKVADSIAPGHQIVKEVHDELVNLLGGAAAAPRIEGGPAVVILAGLHGVGKTTTAAKLAGLWKRQGKRVMLAACDVRRPAAAEQLAILGRATGVDVAMPVAGDDAVRAAARGISAGKAAGAGIVILDTAGRLQIDGEMVAELRDIRETTAAENVLLVVDSAMGQQSVNVAAEFNAKVGITGIVLTKLDGDARGGAALSVRAATGCPVFFSCAGEHIEDIETFHPDRMASRILGMGDVVSLVEKARERSVREDAGPVGQRMMSGELTLEDFLVQLRQMKKLGGIESILDLLPLPGNLRAAAKAAAGAGGTKDFAASAEAIILSMTPGERRRPGIINASRRRRIAAGSGNAVSDVNDVLNRFTQVKKAAKRLAKAGKRIVAKPRFM